MARVTKATGCENGQVPLSDCLIRLSQGWFRITNAEGMNDPSIPHYHFSCKEVWCVQHRDNVFPAFFLVSSLMSVRRINQAA